ncbi:MAG: hypothetical protein HRU19_18585 [Pseudobacteriovorax sp.]|nr:hypothetical protein [Pseudobacteriovorax sp.]
MKLQWGLLFLIFCLSQSCSIKTIAINQLAPILSEASPRLQKEKNWEYFRNATPGSLQLAEVLNEAEPENLDLLALLTKGFAAYGYVVNDTEFLADKLNDEDESPYKTRAILNLAKALQYGMTYLQAKGVTYQGILEAGRNGRASQYLTESLSKEELVDLETAFFTGTAWLLLANLKKDDMVIVSQVPSAFELISWVCQARPDFQNGLCPTMQAVYFLARPPTLGGKPKKAVSLLTSAMKANPNNLLIPVVLIEWYLIPRGDKKTYEGFKSRLNKAFDVRLNSFYVPGKPPDKTPDNLHLFNAMAEQRYLTILKYEDDLF